jgi:hypothetical protein
MTNCVTLLLIAATAANTVSLQDLVYFQDKNFKAAVE